MYETFEGQSAYMPEQQFQLAHAYIPIQIFEGTYEPEEGLRRGTVFPGLYSPYYTHENLH